MSPQSEEHPCGPVRTLCLRRPADCPCGICSAPPRVKIARAAIYGALLFLGCQLRNDGSCVRVFTTYCVFGSSPAATSLLGPLRSFFTKSSQRHTRARAIQGQPHVNLGTGRSGLKVLTPVTNSPPPPSPLQPPQSTTSPASARASSRTRSRKILRLTAFTSAVRFSRIAFLLLIIIFSRGDS